MYEKINQSYIEGDHWWKYDRTTCVVWTTKVYTRMNLKLSIIIINSEQRR
jgi:hypothetical protein